MANPDWENPQKDLQLLLGALWDHEHFCMWNIKESAAIAYILDRAYNTLSLAQYEETLNNLWDFASTGRWNQFSFEAAFTTISLMSSDESIEEIDAKRAGQKYERIVSDYKLQKATSFWVLDEKYAPAWFSTFWASWLEYKESQMKERFVRSFNKANRKADEDPEFWYRSFKNQDPVLLYELDHCLRVGAYKRNFALVYKDADGSLKSAKDLSLEYDNAPIISIYMLMFMRRS